MRVREKREKMKEKERKERRPQHVPNMLLAEMLETIDTLALTLAEMLKIQKRCALALWTSRSTLSL